MNLGMVIIDKFIVSGSPFELNLTGKLKREDWGGNMKSTDAGTTVFDSLLTHCEQDMLDNFSRFVHTGEYKQLREKV
jgi:hypothetical protein